jgi:hypothetical protein
MPLLARAAHTWPASCVVYEVLKTGGGCCCCCCHPLLQASLSCSATGGVVVPEERLGGTEGKEVFAEKKGLSIFKDKVRRGGEALCTLGVCAVAIRAAWGCSAERAAFQPTSGPCGVNTAYCGAQHAMQHVLCCWECGQLVMAHHRLHQSCCR